MLIPKTLRVGTRDSLLALAQTNIVVEKIKKLYPDIQIELVALKTTGDLILDKTLDKIGGKGLFVKELDNALLTGEIDISVSSLKDLPAQEKENLPIIAYIERGDPRDALVLSPENKPINIIGTSSARRRVQLLKSYPDAEIRSVRGNIISRLKKLDSGEYSALVLAASGLKRAGLANRISRTFTTEEIVPAAGQGTIAVQASSSFDAEFLAVLNHEQTQAASICERSFINVLDGGCSSPIAAYATVDGDKIKLSVAYTNDENSGKIIRLVDTGDVQNAAALGKSLALKCYAEADKAKRGEQI